MRTISKVFFPVLFLAAFMIQACNDSSSDSSGTLSVKLTDAATSDLKAAYVTVKQVQVHRGGDAEGTWIDLSSPNKTYNLLGLVNGVMEQLGLSPLETGVYTQLRLIIGDTASSGSNILGSAHPYANYVIDGSNQYHELRIPSGYQSGIKLVNEFQIVEGLTTELILDFDVEKSIVKSGNSGNWQLKPTIKVIGTVNKAIVSGIVKDAGQVPIPGVKVSAQVYGATVTDVTVAASTLTDENGEYQMYLDPGVYVLVAYKDGYSPGCAVLTAGSNEDYEQTFTLAAMNTGTVTCNVTMSQGSTDEVITIHFLGASSLDTNLIEMKVLNVSQTGAYTVDLPAGNYTVVASNGAVTLPAKSVSTGGSVALDFSAQ